MRLYTPTSEAIPNACVHTRQRRILSVSDTPSYAVAVMYTHIVVFATNQVHGNALIRIQTCRPIHIQIHTVAHTCVRTTDATHISVGRRITSYGGLSQLRMRVCQRSAA